MKSRTGRDENKLFGSGKELFMAAEHLRYYSAWWRPRFMIYKPAKINFTQEVDIRRLSVFKIGSSLFQGRSESAIWYGGSTTGGSEEPFLAGSKPTTLRSAIVATVSSIFVSVVRAKSSTPHELLQKFSSCELCHWDFSWKKRQFDKMRILASSIFPLFAALLCCPCFVCVLCVYYQSNPVATPWLEELSTPFKLIGCSRQRQKRPRWWKSGGSRYSSSSSSPNRPHCVLCVQTVPSVL